MPVFEHAGLRFHYLDRGQGTPFVFQHGLGASVQQPDELYRPQLGFRFIALDCRYHGDTQPLGDPDQLCFDTFADDVLALVTYLGLGRLVVGGISLGAGVALNFALRRPQHTLGLVLSRPAWLDRPMPANQRALPVVAGFIRQFGLVEGLERFQQSETYAEVQRQSPDSAASLLSQFTGARAEEAVARLERLPNDVPNRQREAWAAVQVPALVLGTRGDLIHPYEFAETLAHSIPGAALKEITPKSISPERYRVDTQDAIAEFLQARFA